MLGCDNRQKPHLFCEVANRIVVGIRQKVSQVVLVSGKRLCMIHQTGTKPTDLLRRRHGTESNLTKALQAERNRLRALQEAHMRAACYAKDDANTVVQTAAYVVLHPRSHLGWQLQSGTMKPENCATALC